jgi:Ca2+-transporting ATPase
VAVHVPILGMSLVPLLATDWPLVLLPVQVAFLELIIDPACSVVFEAEAVDPEIMHQPPRPRDAPIFGTRTLVLAALQGLSVFAAVLAVYLYAVLDHRPDGVVRSMAFTTLLVGNLSLILVNRSWRLSVWRTFAERRNPTLKWILLFALTMLTVLLTVPGVRDAFDFGPMTLWQWLLAAAAGVVGVSWFEMSKAIRRRR